MKREEAMASLAQSIAYTTAAMEKARDAVRNAETGLTAMRDALEFLRRSPADFQIPEEFAEAVRTAEASIEDAKAWEQLDAATWAAPKSGEWS